MRNISETAEDFKTVETGDIVMLRQQYRPDEWTRIKPPEWLGFTHGIVVQVLERFSTANHQYFNQPRRVSLHLFDLSGQLFIYPEYIQAKLMIPAFVDYHVSELTLYERVSESGYRIISNPPDWSDIG